MLPATDARMFRWYQHACHHRTFCHHSLIVLIVLWQVIRSLTAETGKDGPLAYTAAAALVVGCCIIALQLLPVSASLMDAAAAAAPKGTNVSIYKQSCNTVTILLITQV